MTKPIIKKAQKVFISYSPNMPENIQIEILSILGVDKSNTDTNALFNKINYQTAFLAGGHNLDNAPRPTDFVNSSQTLKKTTFKLLNELANLNSYVLAELNTELPPNDSYPSFSLHGVENELAKLIDALTHIEKKHSKKESRGSSQKLSAVIVANNLRSIFKEYTHIKHENTSTRDKFDPLTLYEEKEAEFIAIVMNLYRNAWDIKKVRRLLNDNDKREKK